MKKRNSLLFAGVLTVAALLFSTLSSFRATRGGEGFEVYLNNKQIASHYGKELSKQARLELDPSAAKLELKVIYYHCGENGKKRQLVLRDEKNQSIHTWNFADETKPATAMVVRLDQLDAYKNAKGTIRWTLHYFSKETPSGRALAVVEQGGPLARK